jgi:tetratricopeptide (TPR) repeat protein
MSKEDLKTLREQLGVSRTGSKKGGTLVGHATPSSPPESELAAAAGPEEEAAGSPEQRQEAGPKPTDVDFDLESTLTLSASDIEIVQEAAGGEIIEADLEDVEPAEKPPRPPTERTPPRPPTEKRPPTPPGRSDGSSPASASKSASKSSRESGSVPAVGGPPTPTPSERRRSPTGTGERRRSPTGAGVRQAAPPVPAPPPAAPPLSPPRWQPSVSLGPTPTEPAEPVEPPPEPAPAMTAEEESAFYRREADAMSSALPERAGLMRVAAAKTLSGDVKQVVSQLEAALSLAPKSAQVLLLVRDAMGQLGNHDRVLELTDKLIELGGDNRIRVATLLEAATVTRYRNNDGGSALRLLSKALELEAGQVAVLSMRAALQVEEGQVEEAVASLEQLADSVGDARERALVLLTAGTLLEFRLDNGPRAEELYRRAVESDPDNLFALLALRDLHQRQAKWHELCDDLERIAAVTGDTAAKARYLLRAGSLHLDRTGDLEAAARCLSAASAAAPEDMGPLTRLAQVHEETGRYQELVDALTALLNLTLEPAGRPPLLCRIGSLLRHRLNQPDRAIEVYRQALTEQPGYLPALLALGTLHRQRGDYEGLVSILAPEAEGTDDPERRAVWCLEVADINASRLNQPDEAIRFYRRALELAPGHWGGFWRLHRLLSNLQRHDALAELLKQRAEVASDTKTRNYLLLQLARLQAGPLHEIDQAIEVMQRARRGGCRVASVELTELYERSGQYGELVDLLLSEAKDTCDEDEARGRRLQAAALLEDNLGEYDRALEIYNEILEDDPANSAAIHAAGRMYHRLGRWKDLLELHRHELNVDPARPDAAELLFRIGRLNEEHLGQSDEAVEAYMEALQRDPSYRAALEAVVRNERRHSHLIDMLERHAGVLKEPFAAADVLCRAAELTDAHLHDLDRAARLYVQALERSPAFRGGLQGLLDVRLRQGRFEEAAGLLEQLVGAAGSEGERGQLLFRLARLKEFRCKDEDGRDLYDEASAVSPHGGYLRGERLRVRRLAASALADLAQALKEAAEATEDDPLAAAFWLHAASLHELDGAWDAQLGAAERAFRLNSELPAASWSLQRALRRMGEWGVLAALAEQEAEHEQDAVLQLSLMWAASRAHLRGGARADAQRLAQRCLELDGEHLPSLNLLTSMAEEDSRWEELAALQDRVTAATEHRKNRTSSALRACDIWAARVGDSTRALASLQPALTDDPGEGDVFSRAERLLTAAGNFTQLSKLYTRRIVASSDSSQKADLLRDHARLLMNKLGDAGGAISELGKLLELRPDDVDALSQRADLLCSQGRWSDAADTLASLIDKTGDTEKRRDARLLQAQIWLNQLHEPGRSRDVLAKALEEEPDSIAVKQGLVQVAFAEGEWDGARKLLDEIAANDQPHLQVWALTRQADVAHFGLRDEALRDNYEREALLLAGGHPPVLDEVIDRFRERGEQKRLAQVASDVLGDTSNADVASAMRLALARVMLEDMKKPDDALEWLRESLVRDPNDPVSNLLFARALEQKGEMEEAVSRYRTLIDRDPACAEAYRGLSRLMSLLGSPAVAASALAALELHGEASAAELQLLDTLDDGPSPGGRLEVAGMPADAAFHPVRRVLNLVLPHLGPVCPLRQGRVLRPTEPPALAAGRLATALGIAGVHVSVEGTAPAAAGVGEPVPLQISAELSRNPKTPAFRFWVGRALAFSALGGALADQLSDRELGELFEALFVSRPIDPVVQQLRRQIHKAMPRRSRKAAEQLGPPPMEGDFWDRFRAFARRRSGQVGLLTCGNPRAALAELTRGRPDSVETPEIQRVLQFMVSEEYANYHRSLWSGAVTA